MNLDIEESSTDSEHSASDEALADHFSSEVSTEYNDVFSEPDMVSSATAAFSPSALSARDITRSSCSSCVHDGHSSV